MRRRRFLALAAGSVLGLAGCGWPSRPDRTADDVGAGAEPGGRAEDPGGPAATQADGRPQPPDRSRDDSGGQRAGGEADGERPATADADPDEAGARPDDRGAGPDHRDPADAVDPDAYPRTAREWGERVTGVRTRLDTDARVVALTFDACGGPGGSGYDAGLVEFLVAERVPATLFVNRRWIAADEARFARLANESLFELGNHGTEHRPLSVQGRSAYGIRGTGNPAEVVEEVMGAQREIERLAGLRCAHFRPGTAYSDEVAVRIVADLGLEVVGFDVLGDAGATFTADQVRDALVAARPGSIALLHMNHPVSGTARGVMEAVPVLRDRGFEFATLGQHRLV